MPQLTQPRCIKIPAAVNKPVSFWQHHHRGFQLSLMVRRTRFNKFSFSCATLNSPCSEKWGITPTKVSPGIGLRDKVLHSWVGFSRAFVAYPFYFKLITLHQTIRQITGLDIAVNINFNINLFVFFTFILPDEMFENQFSFTNRSHCLQGA